jgi:antitoxin (DNA-binding transcriptional repressor) of toxin-antitoxin stability system
MYMHMKRYTVAQARMRIAEVLDSAERGESVVIERQGIRFQVLASKPKPARKRAALLEILDPSVAAGNWTWTEGPGGWTFTPRKPR